MLSAHISADTLSPALLSALTTDLRMTDVARTVEESDQTLASSRQMRLAQGSNQYRASRDRVTVTIGGAGWPQEFAVGAQFGAITYRQFPGPSPAGYTTGTTLLREEDSILKTFLDRFTTHFN